MAVTVKPGTRLRSAVCDTEVVVVKAAGESVDLRCGGHPMAPLDESPPSGLTARPPFGTGTALGKRYVDETSGLEVLCTKPGAGALSAGDVALAIKEAKPLPASD
jgi:hypothetical protein